MKNNMRGFIEPYTLGFILALLGTSLGYLAKQPQQDEFNRAELKSEVSIKTTAAEVGTQTN